MKNKAMLTGETLGAAIKAAINLKGVSKVEVAQHFGVKPPSVQDWINRGTISKEKLPDLWEYFSDVVGPEHWGLRGWSGLPRASAPSPIPSKDAADLEIVQFAAGGSMGYGFNLQDHPPGYIKSWRVDREWFRQNVPVHTGISNLCIVTGFGHSMRPMYNPGDPLLVDTGVNVVDHEGVYFFRVGDEGFIKLIQRVPEFNGKGIVLRIISKNPDFPPYDISPQNPHFEVLGKVLTVWRSEQY